MNGCLHSLMEAGQLSPLAYYFARFVARGCNRDEDSTVAISAALVCTRNLQGDVCVDLAKWSGQALFESPENPAAPVPAGQPPDDWITELKAAAWVGGPGDVKPLILDGTRLYLGRYWGYEHFVADALLSRMEAIPGLNTPLLADGLRRLFAQDVEEADVDWQKVAAAIAASRRFAIISGGPGTGKTTTVIKVLALLLEQEPSLHVALAAPTGKAAARLSEAVRSGKTRVDAPGAVLDLVPEEAETIHRLLGYGSRGGFRHNHKNPLVLDCVVIDEASMIDLPLMACLLDALPGSARIILLGDRDQLSSVEAGNVLGDITGHGENIFYSIAHRTFLESLHAAPEGSLPAEQNPPAISDAVGLLHKSYRFSAHSGIAKLAGQVNAGHGRKAFELITQGSYPDLGWLNARDDALNPRCLEWAVERYSKYLKENDVQKALFLYEQYRVLSALHHGSFGIDLLNQKIADRLQDLGLIRGGREYHGKPVMVTANDYEINLFNGDIGLLWQGGNGEIRAWFPAGGDKLRSVSVRQLPQHECAFALTVHKSQGSEFDEVMLVLPGDMNRVLSRELVYTGITRARRHVTIQGCPDVFAKACRRRVERTSGLGSRLGWH